MHEASLYEDNCFITLTYDDKYLPYHGSLDISDLQGFMKRLRKRYGSGIRFFACGEYGSVTFRPHYHALLFNHDFRDRVPYKESDAGSIIYTSKDLASLWPKGFSSVSDLTVKSAGYVARYNIKKALDPKEMPDELSREFVNMSRRPGIGKVWFDKFKGDVYPSDEVVMLGGSKMKPPRYYDSLLDKDDPDLLSSLKLERKKKGTVMVPCELPDGRTILVNDNDSFRLPVKEEVFRASLSKLKRSL